MVKKLRSSPYRVYQGAWRDPDGRLAHHSVFQVELFYDPSGPLANAEASHTHNFAIISERASEETAIVAAEVLYQRGYLKPVAFIIVEATEISFVVGLGNVYMNKRLKWGRWKQGVHFACRSTGYRGTVSCLAFEGGRLRIGRNCAIWSSFTASQMLALDQRWGFAKGQSHV
ncbi:hypothetical protein [Rhizobium ruizarguesonis]|jgi:hypothetical protein|uniref:hypothetical protein n=1 Tax=Rhizobium ruizarguesonis TaxID=2081791 RepID=UPI001030ADB4|nr:hypothetical protein [Rhizobium ruizarguesonis]NEI29659.1 hypothetical protein [Rhizobium ruizarguesonis]TBB91900.1 hypothetical protein ELH38_07305 [Rhizobium ruizarguesonis]